MKNCEQTKGQTIFEHGLSVRDHLLDLINHLRTGSPLPGWRLPDWLMDYKKQILSKLLPDDILQEYAMFHDIGKPFCKQIDENGKIHFPNHEIKSHDIWLEIGGSPITANLILMDMDIHRLKAEGIDEFCSRKECISLLLTGLSEIHSNSAMFGGIESESFKIKWKHIDRRGKAICKKLFG